MMWQRSKRRSGALSHEEETGLIRSLIADLDGPEDAGVEQAWLEEAEWRHRELLDATWKKIES